MEILVKCLMCNESYTLKVSEKQSQELLLRSKPIQEILPDHTPSERELLISGICGSCYGEICGE